MIPDITLEDHAQRDKLEEKFAEFHTARADMLGPISFALLQAEKANTRQKLFEMLTVVVDLAASARVKAARLE